MNLAWGQFLDFYSDLNNARKAHEDNFIERNYIGEELVEPDEKPVNNMELIDNFGSQIDMENYGEDLQQHRDSNDTSKKDFYDAFDDGFDSLKKGGDSKAPLQDAQVQNLLGDLQREIREEESAAQHQSESRSVALLAEDKVEEADDDK